MMCCGKWFKGTRETAELNASTVHAWLSESMFTQPASCLNLSRKKKVILPFSRQINPKNQVNSPPAQEIPVSHAMRDSIVLALVGL